MYTMNIQNHVYYIKFEILSTRLADVYHSPY